MQDYSVKEHAQHRLEMIRCARSFSYWVDTYAWMWLKEGGDPIRWRLWEFQKEAADTIQNEQQVIVLKARQMGLSWLISAYTLWKCMFLKNFHAYYTSIGLIEVQEQMGRVRFIFNNLPDWMVEDAFLGGKDCKDNDKLIEFTNGSAIHATSSGKSAGHGSAPGLVVCDEWSRVENAQEKWRAIKPSLGKNSQIIVVSTSDGLQNHFAELWFAAVGKSNEFYPLFIPADRHPDYTPEYLENQKSEFLGDMQGYMQAFPMSPEDAFHASSRSVFDHDRISQWMELINKTGIVPKVGYVERNFDSDQSSKYVFVEDTYAHCQMWKEPVKGHKYTMGVDVATGIINGDWSVFTVYDTDTREIVFMFRDKIAPEAYAFPIENVARYYNNAWVCVEVNTASEIIIGDLKQGYPWLYMRQTRERIADLPTNIPGFYTTSTSKPRIITAMRRLFSDNERPLAIYSQIILNEMLSFEQREGGKQLEAAKNKHDDCVMSVALAIEAMDTMPDTTADYAIKHQRRFMGYGESHGLSWRSF